MRWTLQYLRGWLLRWRRGWLLSPLRRGWMSHRLCLTLRSRRSSIAQIFHLLRRQGSARVILLDHSPLGRKGGSRSLRRIDGHDRSWLLRRARNWPGLRLALQLGLRSRLRLALRLEGLRWHRLPATETIWGGLARRRQARSRLGAVGLAGLCRDRLRLARRLAKRLPGRLADWLAGRQLVQALPAPRHRLPCGS